MHTRIITLSNLTHWGQVTQMRQWTYHHWFRHWLVTRAGVKYTFPRIFKYKCTIFNQIQIHSYFYIIQMSSQRRIKYSGTNIYLTLGLLATWPAPSHYLNKCWHIVNWTLRNKLQWNFIEILRFSFKKMHLKVSSAKWRPFCLSLNVSSHPVTIYIMEIWGNLAIWQMLRCHWHWIFCDVFCDSVDC